MTDKLFTISESKGTAVFFHSQQVYLAMSKILRFGNVEMLGLSPKLLERLTCFLFMISDECEPDFWQTNMSPSKVRRHIAGELWLTMHLYDLLDRNVGTELARAYEVFSLAKGLEFDVVFIMGMAESVFPDYRATDQRSLSEEQRNAFVAVTRSKRILRLSYPKRRLMPWGDVTYVTSDLLDTWILWDYLICHEVYFACRSLL